MKRKDKKPPKDFQTEKIFLAEEAEQIPLSDDPFSTDYEVTVIDDTPVIETDAAEEVTEIVNQEHLNALSRELEVKNISFQEKRKRNSDNQFQSQSTSVKKASVSSQRQKISKLNIQKLFVHFNHGVSLLFSGLFIAKNWIKLRYQKAQTSHKVMGLCVGFLCIALYYKSFLFGYIFPQANLTSRTNPEIEKLIFSGQEFKISNVEFLYPEVPPQTSPSLKTGEELLFRYFIEAWPTLDQNISERELQTIVSVYSQHGMLVHNVIESFTYPDDLESDKNQIEIKHKIYFSEETPSGYYRLILQTIDLSTNQKKIAQQRVRIIGKN